MPSKNVFDFQITIEDDDPASYNLKAKKLFPFEYGNDDDIDSILYPNSVKIEFGLFGSGINAKTGYYSIINKLSFVDSSVVIYKNNVEIFKGFVDQKEVDGIYEEQSIVITILSNFAKLKDIDPRTLDYNNIAHPAPTGGAACSLFTDVITETIKLIYPGFGSTFIMSDIKASTDWDVLGEKWDAPAQNFGDYAYRLWGEFSAYETCIELIRGILSSLGCIGIVKDNKFIMQSRFYFQAENEITISPSYYVKHKAPSPYFVKEIRGLQILVKPPESTSTYEAIYGLVEKDDDGNIKNEDEVETIIMSVVGGDPPGIDGDEYPLLIRKMWVYIPGYVAGIGNDQWDLAKRNEVYSSAHPSKAALWQIIGGSIWSSASKNRLVYETDVLGLEWEYDKFYKIKNDVQKYRPRKISYDELTYTTKLDLISLTDEVQEIEPETRAIGANIAGVSNVNTSVEGELTNVSGGGA